MKTISRLLAGFLATTLMAVSVVLPSQPVLAENVFQPCENGAAKNSTACKEVNSSTGENPLFGPKGILTSAIKLLSIIVAIAAVFTILYAGLKFVTSGSNPQDVSKARELILYAVVGLIIAALAQAIVRFFLNRIGA